MKGLIMMLKAFGLADEDVERIKILIPQVPAFVSTASATINKNIIEFDKRLKALEKGQQETLAVMNEILKELRNGRT